MARKSKQMSRESLAKRAVFREWNRGYETCLYPSHPPCKQDASAAHSIQNGGTLAEVSERGRVYMLKAQPTFENPPKLPNFQERGRNQATTFKGLCNPHDSDLFRPIDTESLDLASEKHIFLLTYRSILKEAHSAVQTGNRMDEIYKGFVAEGIRPAGDTLDEAAMSKASNDALPLLDEKAEMDNLYLAGDYGGVEHVVVPLSARPPELAVSGFFSAGRTGSRERWCALNVFPHEGRHLIVFSFRSHNGRVVKARISDRLAMVPPDRREQAASRVILENCANFVVRPSLYESYSPGQRRAIRNYFWGTTVLQYARFLEGVRRGWGQELATEVGKITGGLTEDNPHLNLFEAVA